MMIKIEAIVREEVFEDVKEALNAIDVNGITVSQVMDAVHSEDIRSWYVVQRLMSLCSRRSNLRS